MDEQRTIRIIGLEGKVNLEDLHKGIYLIMGKPECVRVQIVTKDEPSHLTITNATGAAVTGWLKVGGVNYQPVHFWEDQPTAAFWDSFVDVAAGEVIIADAWFEEEKPNV